MQIDLSKKEFRRLLDMVYIGNWILNSTRGDDRFADYDDLESKLFALCREQGMDTLVERYEGTDVPSRAFSDGGIHEAIMDYEDTVFYEILAESLRGAIWSISRYPTTITRSLSPAWTTTLRNSRPTGRTIFSFPTWISHNRKRQCRIGHWRFYVSALSGARQYGSAPSACKALTVSAADRGMESTYKLSV